MAPFNRKFGSPFDPMGGKKQRENTPAEQHKLRGCNDQNCAACNPETAGQGLPSPTARSNPRRGPGGSYTIDIESNPADYMRNIVFQELERRVIRDLTEGFSGGGGVFRGLPGGGIERKKEPPASYRAARSAVEKYIVPAPDESFENIIGNDEALALLKDALTAPVTHKELYEAYGMKAPKGALLSGPPGCGKTMFAKAAVSEMKKLYGETTEFLSISGTEIQSPWVGQTEAVITSMFLYAREYQAFHGQPLLIFIDEAETLLPDRTGRTRRVAPWEESQVATFLAEMDGMKANGAFLMLATNRPEVIDQAVLRDGRCDFKITVKRPTKEAVNVILRKGFEAVPLRQDAVADLTFAALESLYDPAMVIMPCGFLEIDGNQKVRNLKGRDFTLEHIISGAMAVAVPGRAVRHAFARDKALGTQTGVTVDDVLKAVKDIFAENKALEHAFALEEFFEAFAEDLKAEKAAEKKPRNPKIN